MNTLNQFFFGIYPYIALTVFLLGSLVRFEREQYTWKTDSSQLLRGRLRLGNILFHVGILGLFFGHAVGLLTPVVVWDTLGVSHSLKQMVAMVAGGVMGEAVPDRPVDPDPPPHERSAHRRHHQAGRQAAAALDPGHAAAGPVDHRAVRRSHGRRGDGQPDDLGAAHRHLQGDAASHIAGVSPVFKAHLFMGLTLFVIFPFTRLVHVWSGFASLGYLGRAWQLVRPR